MRDFVRAAGLFTAALGLALCSGCMVMSSSSEESFTQLPAPAAPVVATQNRSVVRAVSSIPQHSGQELKVMSFNIRVRTVLDTFGHSWNSRREMLVQTIRGFDPDILGTQEALADQSDYLRSQLPEYSFVGAGRDDGKRGGEMCGVYFKSTKFTQIASGHFWLSSTPDVVGSKSWGSAFTRMVTWVKLQPKEGSAALCVFDTHFDVFGSRARLESAKLLRQRMQSIAAGMPCIITGDFNDSPGSAPYQTLLASANGTALTDAFRAANPTPKSSTEGTRHDYKGNSDGPRIDWILSTPGITPVSAKVIHTNQNGKFPSDHFPVAATFKLSTPAAMPVARIE